MPRQVASTVTNNFINGVITEATALNFPENACTDADNVVFKETGKFSRRLGIDFEDDFSIKLYPRRSKVVKPFLWRNVTGNGDISFIVVQTGPTLNFYQIESDTALSGNPLSASVTLTTYKAPSAPSADFNNFECDFTIGKGDLFVTHPSMTPIYIRWNTDTETFTVTEIDIKIRDFEGLVDDLEVDERIDIPSGDEATALTYLAVNYPEHLYNLYNQGWDVIVPVATTADGTGPAGTRAAIQQLSQSTSALNPGIGVAPSNADVWWLWKDANEFFKPKLALTQLRGNSPAPKGHYILDAFYQDRSGVSDVGNFDVITPGYQRPSTVEFFAGRVFYAGVAGQGFNNKIYFSQIIEGEDQYGKCYQQNDPTSEHSFDLLSTDGGVINILNAGTIIKLFAMENVLVVFCTNGVWTITGSQNLGFSANDYTVKKNTTVQSISLSSFTDIAGVPAWWNQEGIYTVTVDPALGSAKVVSMTDKKIKTYFKDQIPLGSKSYARGFYNSTSKIVMWLYRSTEAVTVTQQNEYDKALLFNVLSGAFYFYTFNDSLFTKINGVISAAGLTGTTDTESVTDSSGAIVTDSGAVAVTVDVTTTTQVEEKFRYLVSYSNGTSNNYYYTFAEERDTNYVDWASFDTGIDYTSYAISGYKVHGDAQKKFQTNYVYVFTENTEPSVFHFQSIWDYAVSGDSGRWSSKQLIQHAADTNYGYKMKRLKMPGMGLSCQFKITSIAGQPFDVVGWSTWQTMNASI